MLRGCVRWSLCERYGHEGPGICLGDGQTEACLKDMDMTGLASAWAMVRWRPDGWTEVRRWTRRRVHLATVILRPPRVHPGDLPWGVTGVSPRGTTRDSRAKNVFEIARFFLIPMQAKHVSENKRDV